MRRPVQSQPQSVSGAPPRRRDAPNRRHRWVPILGVAIVLVGLMSSCGDDDAATTVGGVATIRVPADHPTISEAVEAAKDGDLILVAPGVYKEAVTVETPNITIRGLDRNGVVVDGEFARENGIKVVSNGVSVENLTVRNHLQNGIFFTGSYSDDVTKNQILSGYRTSYVTAYDNGLYGVYVFNATKGQIDHSYGSGHPDSGFYVGQCNPCDSLLIDLVAEHNMLGYSGTNSTGVTILNSVWRKNRAGIVPNSLKGEKLGPNSGTVIAGNLVEDNDDAASPNNESFSVAFGNGVVLAGTSNVDVHDNLVRGHVNAGIALTDLPDAYKPEHNRVTHNTLSGNGTDLVYLTVNFASLPFGNCFGDNTVTSVFPEGLQTTMACPTPAEIDLGDLSGILGRLTGAPPDVDYKTVAAPPDQPNMPDAATAPVRRAADGHDPIDLASVKAPTP